MTDTDRPAVGAIAVPSHRLPISILFSLFVTLIVLGIAGIDAQGLGFSRGAIWTLIAGLWLAVYATAATLMLYSHSRHHQMTATLLNAIMEKSRAGRVVLDPEGLPVCANSEVVRLTRGSATREGLEELFNAIPASIAAFRALQAKGIGGQGAEMDIESRFGGGAWFNVSVNPIPGWPGFLQWRLANITRRHTLEEERRIERAKLIDFLDNAPGGFFSVGSQGEFLFVNRTFAHWMGASVDEMLTHGRKLHEFMETPPLEGKPYDLVSGGGQSQHDEVVFRSLAGALFPASITQTVVLDEDGGIRTRAVVRDLLEEREWQAALAQSQRRFQRFFEDAPLGIALVDPSGIVLECNATMAAIIGRPINETPGLVLDDLLSPGDRARVTPLLAGNQDIPDHPFEVRLAGEGDRVAQLFVRMLHETRTDEKTFILHFIDFTERKNLEVQFAQSQKMQAVGQLAGGIAHDFNNLLTAMTGFCDLLLLRHKPGDPSFGDLMHIKHNAIRAAGLVRQILAFSRQQTLQPRVMDITDALADFMHTLKRMMYENIEFQMVHGRDLWLVKVDQSQLEQVLMNMCVNARDAMSPRGGKLTVKTMNRKTRTVTRTTGEDMPPGDWVVIGVSDTGTGMPANILSRIFEPFFSTKEVGKGTGLGLSTAYGIVRQTGGFVHVDSVPGEGTTFLIYLPRHEEDAKGEGVHAMPALPESREEKPMGDLTGIGQILLVEDEDAVRMFSARALTNKGYQVHEAASGEAALEVFSSAKVPIDLLITDVIMPQMDGPTLVREVRKTQPDLKVIFISGYTEDRVRSQLDSDEEIHFLPKPFTLKQLAVKVKEVMFPER